MGGVQVPIQEGSSPLTRGKLSFSNVDNVTGRLIPAHAGKTSDLRAQLGQFGAHPRSRGENSPLTVGVALSCGSSPLTRGKPVDEETRSFTARLIPAHAGKTEVVGETPTGPAAHPRSRGENTGGGRRARRCWGSSPLTRGKQGNIVDRCAVVRLIPAHAGKTRSGPWSVLRVWAHPRSRGENAARGDKIAGAFGSSPLTRGKLHGHDVASLGSRLIPAHAGKTRRPCRPFSPTRAHPRSRGEN